MTKRSSRSVTRSTEAISDQILTLQTVPGPILVEMPWNQTNLPANTGEAH
jgi:hypothetical protein